MQNSLTASSFISNAFALVAKNTKNFLILLGAGQVILTLLAIVFSGGDPFGMNAQDNLPIQLLWMVLSIPVSVLMFSSALILLQKARNQQYISWKEALQLAAKRFWSVLWVGVASFVLFWLLLGLGMLIGFVVFILLGLLAPDSILLGTILLIAGLAIGLFYVLVLGMFSTFSIYSCVLEQTSFLQSFGRGFALIKVQFWKTLLLFVLLVLLLMLLGLGIWIIQSCLFLLSFISTVLSGLLVWLVSIPCAMLASASSLGLANEIYTHNDRCLKEQNPSQNGI